MTNSHATYHIETADTIIDFESNIPVTMLQDFLRREDNRFNLEKFIDYVDSFKHVKKYFINLL